MADTEDRTEAPTPRRQEKAREEGKVPVSREMSAFVGLTVWTLLASFAAAPLSRSLAEQLAVLLGKAHVLGAIAGAKLALTAGVMFAAPFVLVVLCAGSLASLVQSGFVLSFSRLMPDLSRASPGRGLARLFGGETLSEAGLSLVKLVVAAAIAWRALSGIVPVLFVAPDWQPLSLVAQTFSRLVHLLTAMLVGQALIAALDVARSRWRIASSLRMSRQEVRDEHKETEGDPLIKSRIRRLRVQRARRRMMKAVRTAAVVVTNPTHYAVALAYDRNFGARAPRVVAKGVDELAWRIRTEAMAHRVPQVANPPLARALYKVELDGEIPTELFQAVAEVIAYVWRLNGGRRKRA